MARRVRTLFLAVLTISTSILPGLSLPTASASPAPGPRLASLDGTWLPLPPITPRSGHDAVYDPVRRRLIVIGGAGETNLGDVWELNLDGTPEWKVMAPSGTPPSPRFSHTTVYDPIRDRVILYGGVGTSYDPDTWELTLSGTPTWNRIVTPTQPPVRKAHSAIYDALRDRMVIFGGTGNGVLGDVWALSLSGDPVWTALTPSGTGPVLSDHSAIYDPVRDRMIVFGGWNGSEVVANAWTLDFAPTPAWSAPIGGSGARYGHIATYDPVGDRMIMFGGSSMTIASLYAINHIWSLNLGGATPAWTYQAAGGALPANRSAAAAVYDPVTARVVMFGGAQQLNLLNDLWALDLASAPSMSWSSIASPGIHPAMRGQKAVLDRPRNRIIVVNYNSQVLAYDLVARSWDSVSTLGTAPPPLQYSYTYDGLRPDFSMVYDPPRDRLILFGGGSRSDVWSLSLAGTPTWSTLTTSGGPPGARSEHAAIYDPLHDRMIIHGGLLGSGGAVVDGLWMLDLAAPVPTWTTLSLGTRPAGRSGHSAVYDAGRMRMIIFGGSTFDFFYTWGEHAFNDAWALNLTGAPIAWTQLAPVGRPPLGRIGHSAVYDPDRNAMIVFGGESSYNHSDFTQISDPMEMPFGEPGVLGVPPAASHASFELAGLSPNPASGPLTVAFTLAKPGRASIELLDASGRRILERRAEFPAGRHSFAIASAGAVPPGIYFLRLRQGAEQRVRRCCVLD